MNSGAAAVQTKPKALLSQRISELPLKTGATRLRELTFELYRELEAAGIAFKPKTYLSNSWGCPNMVPVIGIPFYLADRALCRLQTEMTGRKTEDDAAVMMLLRHEAGHAFNYAYRLYDEPKWESLFGPFSLPYLDEYRVDPHSTRFVHHLPGCYAQKHPDDDFAETFATWLTPHSEWRRVYARTPALKKLLFVDRAIAEHGDESPLVTGGSLHMPVEEMSMTLGEWYQMVWRSQAKKAGRPGPCAPKCRRSAKG